MLKVEPWYVGTPRVECCTMRSLLFVTPDLLVGVEGL